MKRLALLFAMMTVLCISAMAYAADPPKLVGVWEGQPSVHDMKAGYYTGKLVLNITGQTGNAFHGSKVYKLAAPKKDRSENFSGSISSTGQIYIADHDEGFMIGAMTKDGEMELQYGHNGKTAVAMHVVLKKK